MPAETLDLISVLLPFYNARQTISSALGSVLRQTHRNLEVVAVDDGSTDDSAKFVTRASSKDHRVRLIQLPHRGLCAALNAGIENCRGDLIARMDADDISLHRRLALQHDQLLSHPELGLVGCQVRMFPRVAISDGMRRYESWQNRLCSPASIRRDLFVESPLCHPGVMLRRRLLDKLGGYRDRGWPEDHDLWLRLDEAGVQMAKVPRVLLLWRERAGRLSRRSPAYSKEQFFAVKLHHLLRRVGGRRVLVWGAGREGKPWMRALARRGLLDPRAVDVDPRKLGQQIHGCKIIPPAELPTPSPNRLVLVAVGARGAREEIRAHLDQAGYEETQSYICVA